MVEEEAAPDATVIWGTTFDETLEDSMSLTVIATGFDSNDNVPSASSSSKTANVVKKPADDAVSDGAAPSADDVSEGSTKGEGMPDEDFDDIINILKKSKGPRF